MAEIRLENVVKRFGTVTAVDHGTLTIEDQEFVVLVGPSGCGKSTILRLIAGLEEMTEGYIYIGDQIVNYVEPKDRDIAMVFQNYALYPHMNVYMNMAFGLKLRRFSAEEMDRRVHEAAAILGIDELLDRKPRQLSGGQSQRVAMGRAIVRKPKAFLFDEPLSNLDAKLRVSMRGEIRNLHDRLKTTTVYVTHDQVEAMTLADRVVVINQGVIQQVGAPLEVYDHPINTFVAGFIGSPAMNFIDCRVVQDGPNILLDGESFQFPLSATKDGMQIFSHLLGKEVILGLRPEDIEDREFVKDQKEGIIKATVNMVEPMGANVHLRVASGMHHIIACVSPKTRAKAGENIDLVCDLSKVHLFDKETEKVISKSPITG
ncbi:MAG: sn-glycerol-3-phosphate ABC transporter ATP-binding protein UgpC [Desulfobacterales bacterium]|nr:sn-glycerol-3-phosphate ABC transporter ATP-binding protein UgpC [Desulfobacterales bacterium]